MPPAGKEVRLLIASVDKAREMGMDWWARNPDLNSNALPAGPPAAELEGLKRRIAELEERVVATAV